ncbi:uncharacterized protein Pyn_38138 [Prunus yedoensis var. nudiflora]|uniref:Uncharacterized protein n=1 Tax=Prunus yedoensis var. nudiflora TaxID=2094558 RepID=A0A314V4F1_PRUYE|nr:uncharacterized protein Pyn_38138 [Prunus yedoensis var. nudiflora]
MQKEFSFADQIRAAKNKRMELTMEASSSVHAANKKPGEKRKYRTLGCIFPTSRKSPVLCFQGFIPMLYGRGPSGDSAAGYVMDANATIEPQGFVS